MTMQKESSVTRKSAHPVQEQSFDPPDKERKLESKVEDANKNKTKDGSFKCLGTLLVGGLIVGMFYVILGFVIKENSVGGRKD